MSALSRLSVLLRERGGLIATLVDGQGVATANPPAGQGPAFISQREQHGAALAGSPEGRGVAPASQLDGPGAASAGGPEGWDLASAGGRGPAQIAARGPRTSGDPAEYELLIEAIYEGYLLHYATPRLVRTPEADLALLAGDQLYALGLARLMSLGDIAAVAELADVITLCALAHGASRPQLAESVWEAGAVAIGWGASTVHAHAKELARAGSDQALAAMRRAAANAC